MELPNWEQDLFAHDQLAPLFDFVAINSRITSCRGSQFSEYADFLWRALWGSFRVLEDFWNTFLVFSFNSQNHKVVEHIYKIPHLCYASRPYIFSKTQCYFIIKPINSRTSFLFRFTRGWPLDFVSWGNFAWISPQCLNRNWPYKDRDHLLLFFEPILDLDTWETVGCLYWPESHKSGNLKWISKDWDIYDILPVKKDEYRIVWKKRAGHQYAFTFDENATFHVGNTVAKVDDILKVKAIPRTSQWLLNYEGGEKPVIHYQYGFNFNGRGCW